MTDSPDPKMEAAHSSDEAISADALNKMLETIASSASDHASAIEAGEFSQNGSGLVGRAWRMMAELPVEDLEDAWAEILSISSNLWEEDHKKAALAFLEAAQTSFQIPEIFADRVQASIDFARDIFVITDAEDALETGDEEKALELSKKMSAGAEDAFKAHIPTRVSNRRKTRRYSIALALGSTGLLGATLVIGVVSAINVFHNPPPKPTLPNFDIGRQHIRDILSTKDFDKNAQPTVVIDNAVPSDAPETDIAEPVPVSKAPPLLPKAQIPQASAPKAPAKPSEKVTPEQSSSNIFSVTSSSASAEPKDAEATSKPAPKADASSPTPEAALSPTKDAAPSISSTPKQATAPADAPKAAPASPATPQNVSLRKQCILAYKAANTASAMLLVEPQAGGQDRINSFLATTSAACDPFNLSPGDVVKEGGDIDPARIHTVAQGILRSD